MKQVNAITQVTKALANTEPVNNPYAMNSQERAGVMEWAKLSDEQRKASNFLIDLLYANGKKPHHFVAFNEKEDKQGISFRDMVCGFIVEGYGDKDMVKLYNADPKTLKTADIITAKVLRETVRKDYNNLKSALANRIAKGDKTSKATPATPLQMAVKEIKSAIARLEKVKEGYTNMPQDIKALKTLNILTQVK
jgi:hypothetical protein